MTSYERYLKVLDGQSADIVPRLPILMAFGAKFIGSNYAAFASDYRVLAEANKRCIEHFGFDQLSTISDPYRETQGFGAEIQYPTDEVPRCPHHPLAESRDLSQLKHPDPLQSERMLDRVQAVREFKKYGYQRYSIMGWVEGPAAEAGDLRGVTNFLMDLVDDPEYAVTLMGLCVEVAIEFALAQIEAGADTIGVGDAIASQVSADIYRNLILPGEKRLVEAIHNYGAFVRLHICGNITHLLPHIAQLGVDILDVDWMVSMAEARQHVGNNTALAGNLDPVNAVLKSSPEQISADLKRIYAEVGNPYMVAAGCEIPRDTSEENMKALCAPIPYQ